MKRHKQLRLAWLILALLSLFISATASATSYDCDGGQNPVPANVSGSAEITSSGVCTIGHNVTATGAIYIMAGSIQAQGLQAGDFIQLDSSSGDVQVAGNVNATSFVFVGAHENIAINGDVTSTSDGSSRLRAGGNVSVNNITGSLNGHVIIETNSLQTGSGTFYIGGTGNSNGINGTATSPFAVYVKNFSGGINVVDSSKIVAKAILLDASYGSNTIEIPAGTLSVSQYNDGSIQLLAKTVNFASGAVLSAQNSDTSGHMHGIAISAENINYEGDGLTLNADGDGSNGADGFVYFLANGGTTIALDEGNPYNPYIAVNNGSELASPINVNSTNNAPLTLSANGSYSTVLVQGYPVVFSGGGDTNFRAKGESHNGVYFRNLTTSDMNGFSFTGGTGSVTVDVSGKNGNSGGIAEITGGVASFNKASVNIKANGTAGVDGNAGSIWINVVKLLLNNTEAIVTANGSNNGNGGSIELRPGDEALPVGQGLGKVRFEAKGGDTSGNAGQVKIVGAAGAVTVYGASATSTPIDVSVLGATGDGGVIDIQANAGLTFDGEDTVIAANSGFENGKGGKILLDVSDLTIPMNSNTHVAASGTGTGVGGEVTIITKQSLSVANGHATLSIEAKNSNSTFPWLTGDADGGTIKITAASGSVNLYSGAVAVDGGQKGGTLDVKALNLTLDGTFAADGGAQGDGGIISFEANSLTLPETENTLIRANGNGSGKGGNLYLTTHGQAITVNGDNQKIFLEAKSNDSGNGGTVTIKSDSDVDLEGAFLKVSAGPNAVAGAGGDVSILGDHITVKGILSADGTGNGFPGMIKLQQTGSAQNMIFADATVSASGSEDGDASGHDIDIASASGISFTTTVLAAAASKNGNGFGGSVHISSTNPIVLDSNSLNIIATGASHGDGGIVIINKVKAQNVNALIRVDGGESLEATHFDGSITLNSVLCQQWKTVDISWPKSFWDCVEPTLPTAGQAIASAASTFIPGVITGTPGNLGLVNYHVQIYAMKNVNDYFKFFDGTSSSASVLGATHNSQPVSAAFTQFPDGSSIFQYIEGSIVHELGHSWDFTRGAVFANSPAFQSAVDTDVIQFNSLPCNSAITNMGLPSHLCSDYVPLGWSNFRIYQAVLGIVNPQTTDYQEAWARAFAYRGQIAKNPQDCYPWMQNIQSLMTEQINYMNNVFSSGIPY